MDSTVACLFGYVVDTLGPMEGFKELDVSGTMDIVSFVLENGVLCTRMLDVINMVFSLEIVVHADGKCKQIVRLSDYSLTGFFFL